MKSGCQFRFDEPLVIAQLNPFGLSDFLRDKSKDGSYTIPKGESITFRYRILLHKGDAAAAKLPEAFGRYAEKK